METSRRDPLSGSFRLLFGVGTVAGMSDGELLERFLARRTVGPEAAEVAFGALVERHGPMVLRVCRGQLGDEHDAQDAFQATFLILARKASSIRNRDSAASWLQGVARRIAACSRRASAIRRAKERAASKSDVGPGSNPDQGELVPAVREEVGDLPEKYRTPLMLCLLDGLTHEEAATRLGWPVGTVKTRVRQAKDRLKTRLTRRGFAPSLGVILAALTVQDASALPPSLVRSTARAALRYASGKTMTAGAASASVATLVELGIGSLQMLRIKIAALALTTIGALAAGTAGYARQGPGEKDKAEPVLVKEAVKPLVQPPKTVEPKDKAEDLFDQLNFAKIDLKRLQQKAREFENQIYSLPLTIEAYQKKIAQARIAKTIAELNPLGLNGFSNDLEDGRKQVVEKLSKFIDDCKAALEQDKASYVALNHQIRREEQRIKELTERAEQASPSADPTKRAGDEGNGQALGVDQAESLNVDIEILENEVQQLRQAVSESSQNRLTAESALRKLNGPFPTDSRGNPMSFQEIEGRKKYQQSFLETSELELKTNRALYLAKNRELQEKKSRLVKLNQQQLEAANADAQKRYQAELAEDSNRLDRLIADSIQLDMLRAELEFWKNRVFSMKEANLELTRQASNYQKPPGMTEKEYEASKKSLRDQIDKALAEEEQARKTYDSKLAILVKYERELRNSEKELSPPAQARYLRWQASQKPAESAKPPADAEHRLADVERKLDLILKALEARPGGK